MPRKTSLLLKGATNSGLGKDLRVSGCAICKRWIFSNQEYVWTRQIGYVHKEDCLESVT